MHSSVFTIILLFLSVDVQVFDENPSSTNAAIRKRLTGEDPDLTDNERSIIRQFLETCEDED